MKKAWVAAGLLAVAVGAVGCDSDTDYTSMPDLPKPSAPPTVSNGLASKPAEHDVTLGALGETTYGSAKVDVTILNHSLKRSNYSVDLVVEQGKAQLDTGMTFVENLEPGQSTVKEVVFFELDSVPAGATVRAASVERLAALA